MKSKKKKNSFHHNLSSFWYPNSTADQRKKKVVVTILKMVTEMGSRSAAKKRVWILALRIWTAIRQLSMHVLSIWSLIDNNNTYAVA